MHCFLKFPPLPIQFAIFQILLKDQQNSQGIQFLGPSLWAMPRPRQWPFSFASDQWGLPKLGIDGAFLFYIFIATRERSWTGLEGLGHKSLQGQG